ncbi:MAG: hypothetical protein ACREVE_06580 [Gammaproteobacteria bacterium]
MWFPYSLPVRWKAESDRERINESLSDETQREFLIGFYLHNRVTREWEVELQLKEPHWVPATEDGAAISVGFYPNETGQLTEIICRIQESSSATALKRCHSHVSRILSFWSAVKGRGFAILGFRVADLNHDARWRALPHRPSAESFELTACEILPEPYWPIMALYREARNSPSDTYRLLCCHKILRVWTKQADPFSLLRARAAELGCELAQHHHVDREMLALSGLADFRPDLEGASFDELQAAMAPWRDWAVQAVIDERLPAALDDYEHGLELASVANLADIAVHRILAAEITNWQSVTETGRHLAS